MAKKRSDRMDTDERRRVIRGINERINIFRATARKLRERLLTGAPSTSEEMLIQLELVRLRFGVNDLLDLKAAFKANDRALEPPSAPEIEAMKARVARIEAINAKNKQAKAIIKLGTDLAGGLRTAELT